VVETVEACLTRAKEQPAAPTSAALGTTRSELVNLLPARPHQRQVRPTPFLSMPAPRGWLPK